MANTPVPVFLINLIALSASILLSVIINPSGAVFVSIDCGFNGSSTYKDKNAIVWTGDDAYINNKHDSQALQYIDTEDDWSNSVRIFPALKKNCYTIPVDKAGQRILVRASFFYWGFYDNKTSPTFELQFDGNYWATVNKPNIVSYEAIYVAKQNTTSICLARIEDDQIPFISALEIRSLDFKMYSYVDPKYALLLANRFYDGGNQTLRYPDDAYDRIWVPQIGFGSITVSVKGNGGSIDTSGAQDNPPVAVLRNAVATAGTAWTLGLTTSGLPDDKNVPIYITTYFSEVDKTVKRSLQFSIDSKPYDRPVVPPFGSVAVVYITNMTASSNTSFSIQAAADSSIPPLINAYEVYAIAGPLAQGTNTKDVEGLAALQRGFDVLEKWSGDPCLPSSFAWEWVQCNADPAPRVISLNLGSFGLSGSLPDFSSMDALQTIDLHNNSLGGAIPGFLGSISNLKLLDLSDNRLNGSIPSSLSNNKNLKLVVSGNCLSGMSCSPASVSAPPSPGLQTPAPGGPNPNPIHTPSSVDKEFSGKLQIILLLGAIIHFSLPFMFSF